MPKKITLSSVGCIITYTIVIINNDYDVILGCIVVEDEIVLERFPNKFENIKAPELDILGKILIGKIIKEYPEMNESYPIRYNIYLAEKDGEYSIVLRWTNIVPDANCEPEYYRFNMENVEKLRDILDDVLKTIVAKPLRKKIE